MQMDLAKIIYKPYCDKCGHPIDTDECKIVYQNIYDKSAEALPRKVGIFIRPDKCTHCGALFDSISIELPKQLQDRFVEK